jgi:hypothetical protein
MCSFPLPSIPPASSTKKVSSKKARVRSIRLNDEDGVPWSWKLVGRATYLEVKSKKKTEFLCLRCHFLKKDLPEDLVLSLLSALEASPSWLLSDDQRGKRQALYKGHWCELAHYDPERDEPKVAGKKFVRNKINRKHVVHLPTLGEDTLSDWVEIEEGFWECPEDLHLREVLQRFGALATELVQRWRPDIFIPMKEAGLDSQDFSLFHLFMTFAGASLPHFDRKDFFSFLFPLRLPEEGGGLDFPKQQLTFNWRIGDCVLLDSDSLEHGSFLYKGKENPKLLANTDRIVGLLVIHRPFLWLKGLEEREDLVREKYGSHTVPLPSQNPGRDGPTCFQKRVREKVLKASPPPKSSRKRRKKKN